MPINQVHSLVLCSRFSAFYFSNTHLSRLKHTYMHDYDGRLFCHDICKLYTRLEKYIRKKNIKKTRQRAICLIRVSFNWNATTRIHCTQSPWNNCRCKTKCIALISRIDEIMKVYSLRQTTCLNFIYLDESCFLKCKKTVSNSNSNWC